MVSLPQQKILMLSRRAEQLMFTSVLSAREYMAFLGLLTSTLGLVKSLESLSSGLVSDDSPVLEGEETSLMVAESQQPSQRVSPGRARMGGSLHRCLGSGLGSACRRDGDSGSVEVGLVSSPIQRLGVESDSGSLGSPQTSPIRDFGENKIGQYVSSVLHKKARGNRQQQIDEGSQSYHELGSEQFVGDNSSSYSGGQELSGGCLKQNLVPERRMGAQNKHLPMDNLSVGPSPYRPHGFGEELQDQTFFLQSPISSSSGNRCLFPELAEPLGLHLPSIPDHLQSSEEDSCLSHGRDSHNSRLATQAMVSPPQTIMHLSTPEIAFDGGSLNAGPVSSSESQQSQSCGMEVEKSRLRRRGCSDQVINTLLKARRPGTSNTYHRIWQRFVSWAREKNLDPLQPSTPMILEFLQAGLDYGLSLSSLKVQISALSAVLGERWAEDPLIEQFFKAVLRVKPPVKKSSPPWDLPLVLQALSAAPFEPIDQIPLWWLSLKTVFLVAVTSARRVGELQALSVDQPYTIFHEEKVVLRTVPSFLPKVLSRFHVNEPIILPTLPVENGQSSLDVRRCLQVYIDRTKSLRKSQRLFVVPAGSRKGEAAAKSTLSSWIVKTILQAYKEQGRSSPRAVRAHSTRSIAASWAVEAGVSL
uniref:Tyr recombinase domain-containing protein n=1 Tax=Xenopus tropicalis TaxID=8364 RepID=A0A6I8R7N7_XENTR